MPEKLNFDSVPSTEDVPNIDTEVSELIEHGITQKITRRIDDDGEQIFAVFRCDFEPNQNRCILNIPIHPALQKEPHVETVVFAEGVRTRIADCKKFGVRLELISNHQSNEARSIFIETIISSIEATNK